jgi:uncharacterized protein (TIGR02186 family)
MRQLLAATLAALVALAGPAAAEHLVIALSTSDIRIDSDFTGETVVARRKEPLLFLWVNRSSETFTAAPSYYALSSTRPLDEIAAPQTLRRFGLGFGNIPLHVAEPGEGAIDPEFRDAFIRLRKSAGLYSEFAGGVDFIGASETVFRSAAWIPSNAPDGRYTVEVFLFSGQAFLAHQQATLNVTKVGFEQFMFEASHNNALLYGLACVLLALFTGWLAGVIFRRD